MHIETPFYEMGQFATIFYFVYFIIIVPQLNFFERHLLFKIEGSSTNLFWTTLFEVNTWIYNGYFFFSIKKFFNDLKFKKSLW